MPYIDVTYYNDMYKGETAPNVKTLEKYIIRSSDVIDQVTGYKLARLNFEEVNHFIREQVKKATAAQVEFYVVNEGDAEINAGEQPLNNVSIGSFNYGVSNTSQAKTNRVSPSTITYLNPTGLLYTGIGGGSCAY